LGYLTAEEPIMAPGRLYRYTVSSL